jgi:hypothetical protein
MTDKSKTVVVIESHEQTIIRRSRRTVSGEVLMDGACPDATEHSVLEKPKGRWWLAVALKGVSVFSHWSRRLQRGGNERRNEQP